MKIISTNLHRIDLKRRRTFPKTKIFDYNVYEYKPRNLETFDQKFKNNTILLNLNNINYDKKTFDICFNNNICWIESMVKNDNSKVVETFNKKALEDYISTLMKKNTKLNILKMILISLTT